MHRFFKSDFFDFEATRILGESIYGGSEIAECLQAIGSIKDNDPTSWERAWAFQALQAEQTAKDAKRSGNREATRNALLRASNYHRASGYMLTGSARFPPPTALSSNRRVRDIFLDAAQLFDHGFRVLEIPFEDMTLPAYLYTPRDMEIVKEAALLPLIINIGGDSIQEELYYMFPVEGPKMGYAVLTFDGPGQGMVLRQHGRRMRPDWETVTSAVLDYLEDYVFTYPDVRIDLERVAVAGATLGGYFALRAASDPRIKACVAIDPFYDLWDFVTAHIGERFINLWMKGWISNWTIDRLVNLAAKFDFQLQWEISTSGQMFGRGTPSEMLLEMRRYTLKTENGLGTFLDQVQCPVFVSGATSSIYTHDIERHTMQVFRCLKSSEKTRNELWLPDQGPGSGSLQAKMGALPLVNMKVYAFLDKVFGVRRDEVR